MSERKWTKGPWHRAGVKRNSLQIVASSGRHVADCQCSVGISDGEKRANANLVAAAPDLYEALAEFVKWVEDEATATAYDAGMGVSEWASFIPTYLSERFNIARAALQRAEGEGT